MNDKTETDEISDILDDCMEKMNREHQLEAASKPQPIQKTEDFNLLTDVVLPLYIAQWLMN
jgi:hypothetical protein